MYGSEINQYFGNQFTENLTIGIFFTLFGKVWSRKLKLSINDGIWYIE